MSHAPLPQCRQPPAVTAECHLESPVRVGTASVCKNNRRTCLKMYNVPAACCFHSLASVFKKSDKGDKRYLYASTMQGLFKTVPFSCKNIYSGTRHSETAVYQQILFVNIQKQCFARIDHGWTQVHKSTLDDAMQQPGNSRNTWE